MLGKASVFSLLKLGSSENNFVTELISEMEFDSQIFLRQEMEWEGIGGSVSFIIIEGSSSLACHTESPWNRVPLLSLWLTSQFKTLVPVLSHICSPWGWAVSMKRGNWNWVEPCGTLLGTTATSFSPLLFAEKALSPRPSLRSKEQTQAVTK